MTSKNIAPTPLKYKVSATSKQPVSSHLSLAKSATPPKVWYSTEAYNTIRYIIAKCDKEVGWLGLVEEVNGGYLITDVFLPKQTVTSTECDILPEALAEMACELNEPEKLYYWGHSHVNMGVSPSGQDETQLAEYLEHTDVFIRGIYNKAGESKVDVFDTTALIVHQCVQNGPAIQGLTKKQTKALDELIKSNVTARVYTMPGNNYGIGGKRFTPGNRQLNFPNTGKTVIDQCKTKATQYPLTSNPFIKSSNPGDASCP